VYLISRIILYPLCLGIGIWCAVNFKDAFEGREIRKYSIDTDDPGEVAPSDPGEEEPVEGEDGTVEPVENEDPENPTTTETNTPPAEVGTDSEPSEGDTNEVTAAGAEEEKTTDGMMSYFAGMLVSLLTFAFLVARDVGHLTGSRVAKSYYNKSARSEKADLYEEAEQLWADGAFIECIDKLREYTAKYPGEYHAHKRIAEIYEGDLASYRAAAMEYEEILKMDLSPKRWGWAAIHLCNLYSGKLGETEKALELLRRVADECGDTTPGEKARDRLAKIDSL
jgi:hypothetical protein